MPQAHACERAADRVADVSTESARPVCIAKRGTPIGDMIERVLTPGQQNDEVLAAKFGGTGPDFANMVAKIKAIVND